VLASLLLPAHVEEVETLVVRSLRAVYSPALHWALTHRKTIVGLGVAFLVLTGLLIPRLGTEFLPALEEGNLWIRASMPPTISLEAAMPTLTKMRDLLATRSHHFNLPTWAAGQRQRRRFLQRRVSSPKPFDVGLAPKEKLVEDLRSNSPRSSPGSASTSPNTSG
jgi:multidrug efflux pump subunit AcrB